MASSMPPLWEVYFMLDMCRLVLARTCMRVSRADVRKLRLHLLYDDALMWGSMKVIGLRLYRYRSLHLLLPSMYERSGCYARCARIVLKNNKFLTIRFLEIKFLMNPNCTYMTDFMYFQMICTPFRYTWTIVHFLHCVVKRFFASPTFTKNEFIKFLIELRFKNRSNKQSLCRNINTLDKVFG